MPPKRARLGDFGEQAAATYLLRRGYTLVARKWRCAHGELDLVMHEGPVLVFVEVRARQGAEPGLAEQSIGPAKQVRLAALAYAFLEAHAIDQSHPWRIDVVAIDLDRAGRVARINHIRDAIEEA